MFKYVHHIHYLVRNRGQVRRLLEIREWDALPNALG